ncbi:MAG: flagellin [Candidatus Thermoplasmatota archaeon]|nr:flagellin [Candidatus Thermoplasmatota archaeon]
MGRKTKYLTNRKNIAAIGIGAMIVFIAMVLVAGIAASVLVQTSTRLEMQALKTGQETVTEVSSGVTVEGVEGYNASGKIQNLAIEIRPKAGAPDIDLEQAIIEISDATNKYVLTYGSSYTNSSSVDGDLKTGGAWGSATTFGITVLQDADESCTSSTPVINDGDHVILGLDTSSVFSDNSGLPPRTDVSGLVICEEGAAGILGFTTPSSYIDAWMELQ